MEGPQPLVKDLGHKYCQHGHGMSLEVHPVRRLMAERFPEKDLFSWSLGFSVSSLICMTVFIVLLRPRCVPSVLCINKHQADDSPVIFVT